ncbi:hypothetical protein PAPYR_13370 [Paratrimastix pyriformis]|uniref:Uncharacterized protein n=1 Tax=Paratrimastix pyriformis TaxID=342808 RepID=A0ABQ8U3W1_9EUKA|nr:hypothetical protein PAPYR_13370 [Paratrimastix pyriformis]
MMMSDNFMGCLHMRHALAELREAIATARARQRQAVLDAAALEGDRAVALSMAQKVWLAGCFYCDVDG